MGVDLNPHRADPERSDTIKHMNGPLPLIAIPGDVV